jgi:pimeloyl-ACP methyl ester carboxylesterase
MIIAEWQYCQTADEPTSLTVALDLLHSYVKQYDRPLNLLGHSTGGLLALLYARRHPERVRSLILLSVGVYPAVDWQAHYYAQLSLLRCSRQMVLAQTVSNLFGSQSYSMTRKFVEILEQDLSNSLSPHSLYQRVKISPSPVSVPLLVCGSQDDVVIDPNLLQGWQPWLKEGDRLWQCPSGGYFFHYFHPQQVSEKIQDFWNCLGLLSHSPAQLNTNFR